MNPLKWKLHWQILIALVLSALTAFVIKSTGGLDGALGENVLGACGFLGKLFMNALKMIIVPLVGSSIISAMAGLTGGNDFRRMGFKTLAYYVCSGAVAVTIGLVLVNVISPGTVAPDVAARMEANAQAAGAGEIIESKVAGKSAQDIWDVFLRMFPENIIANASNNGQLLGLITFSVLFGFFISRLDKNWRDTQVNFWEGVSKVMISVTDLILKFAPIGVFALVTPRLVELGLDLVGPLAKFTLTVVLGLILHVVALCGVLAFFKVNPWTHLKKMSDPLLTAFSTASSAGTLPLTMETVEQEAKVSQRTASFTLPLGATVNMDGTALYECVVVIFVTQVMAVIDPSFIPLTLSQQIMVVILALTTSIGVAGVPSASIVAIFLIMGVLGIPTEYIGLVWVVDRALDMCRTSVNVFSDTCAAVIIGKTEGEPVYEP
ncbi:dicarboxylate/amino acid:cation symporter [Cerasicoccus arenae]|uniref:Sodium:dicarboxylate symporter n=1 Tax=Cerasicoccus arenae TaxID=424488 RepID=A0A8J3GFJ8_9BACT|nr:dicarboxylate/amino acid:cation symporter [Cerasicoccus arenae]MBK1858048.1 dicarboxylate/amino acid:cation symporter [Cerasicoccus arenae]GHC06731.1 sodium:dicarboxylate symporter [Cerasicoccus arenae]